MRVRLPRKRKKAGEARERKDNSKIKKGKQNKTRKG